MGEVPVSDDEFPEFAHEPDFPRPVQRTQMPDLPERPAQLHDMLHRLFGVGEYDEATAVAPYFMVRAHEIARLKSMLRRRRTSVQQLAKAAWWADVERLPIRNAFQLLRHVSTGVAAWDREVALRAAEVREFEVEDAINEALHEGRFEWAETFVRASPDEMEHLLQDWRDR